MNSKVLIFLCAASIASAASVLQTPFSYGTTYTAPSVSSVSSYSAHTSPNYDAAPAYTYDSAPVVPKPYAYQHPGYPYSGYAMYGGSPVAYSSAPEVSHVSYSGLGVNYGW